MEDKNIKIAVLMCVNDSMYNEYMETFIRKAIESILCQTYKDFNFFIISDNASLEARTIIQSYRDKRIKLIHKELQTGLTDSLNFGLKNINQPYIVRQDADDYSHAQRIEKIYSLILSDSNIGATGSFYNIVDIAGTVRRVCTADPENLSLEKLAGSIPGGGAIIRRDALLKVGGWKYKYAQDFYMWVSLKKLGYKLKNIKEPLYFYRRHERQISKALKQEQWACHQAIIKNECH